MTNHSYSITVSVHCSDPFPESLPEVKSIGFGITDLSHLDEALAAYQKQFEKFVRKAIEELEASQT